MSEPEDNPVLSFRVPLDNMASDGRMVPLGVEAPGDRLSITFSSGLNSVLASELAVSLLFRVHVYGTVSA